MEFIRGTKTLELVKSKSISDAIPSVVITFDQHPTEVTSPETLLKSHPIIKENTILEELGIDYVYVLAFNESRASTPAVKFIKIFAESVEQRQFCRRGFRFGYKRSGTLTFLNPRATLAFQ